MQKLYKLSRFTTMGYETHTIFISTSLEEAERLCHKFYDEYFDKAQEYRQAYIDRDEHYKKYQNYDCDELNEIVWAMEDKGLHNAVFDVFDFYGTWDADLKKDVQLPKQQIINEWMEDVKRSEFDADSLIFHSQTDGD